MRYQILPPGSRPHPLWQAIAAIVGAGVLALLFVLGLVVLAVAAGVVAVGLAGWWVRNWWRRRRGLAPAGSGDDYIVAEYTVVERRRAPPEK